MISKKFLTDGSLVILALLASGAPARADTVQAPTANLQAVLGSAYRSEREAFVGDQCVSGTPVVSAGTAQAGFTFDESMSQQQLSSELGFGLGAKVSYGVTDYSAAASFYNQSLSNSFSVSAAWESSYTFPSDKLVSPTMNSIGSGVQSNDERWAETCGDQYVAEITRGAKLFFSIRIDFSSQQQKEAFQAQFSVSGPMASVNATMNQASASFSQNAKVTLSAYQVGGDVSKLTQLFGVSGEQGGAAIVQCSLGHFDSCADIIQKFLTYATDVQKGFPSQLAPGASPGAAVLSYKTVPYTAIDIYPTNYPFLDQATVLAREKLSDEFQEMYQLDTAARRLLDYQGSESRRSLIEAERKKVEDNISKILPVSDTCYDTPANCWNAVHALTLAPVDEKLFEPASFGELCLESKSLVGSDLATTIEAIHQAVSPASPLDCQQLDTQVRTLTALKLDATSAVDGLSDLSPLSTLVNLVSLTIQNADVSDIVQLSGLVNLRSLNLAGNRISDVSPLGDMTQLVNLDLSSNDIVDVSYLARMHKLQRLSLADNEIADLKSLTSFPDLFSVDVRRNPVAKDSRAVQDFRSNLPTNTVVLY